MLTTKTTDGLRDRLFDTLDAFLDKKLDVKHIEAICYTSEQIIKTGQIELEFRREERLARKEEREYQLQLKEVEQNAITVLGKTIESAKLLTQEQKDVEEPLS